MGTGYSRNDTSNNIADGNIINASDLDGEFDAIQSAFDASTGHTHDGTTAEGAPITVTGPAQEYVSTGTELRPKANNTYDLGSAANQWKDLYIDGTANIDSLVADTADINAGTIDGVTIGGSSAAAGTFTTATATTGNITTVNATTVDTTNIEVTNLKAKDGTAAGSIADSTGVVTLASSVLTTTDINGGTIDGVTIGGSTPAAITGTTITGTSFVTTGDMTFGDNDKAIFGAGSDLQIYHDGSHSRIVEGGTGQLKIQGTELQLYNADATKLQFQALDTGEVSIYYNNSKKLATTSTGIDVTGTVTADGLTIDSNSGDIELQWATGSTHRVGSSYFSAYFTGMRVTESSRNTDIISLDASGIGNINLFTGTAETKRMSVDPSGDISFYEDTGTTPKFFWDASAESLGIGTSSIDSKASLHIQGSDGASGAITNISANEFFIDNNGNTGMTLGSSNTGTGYYAFADSDVALRGGIFYDHSTDDMGFRVSSNTRMTIDASGNVGIGTDSPTDKLNISSSTNQIGLDTGDQATYGTLDLGHFINGAFIGTQAGSNAASNVLRFGTSGTEAMRITSSGNVGIGASSPASILHAAGSTGITLGAVSGNAWQTAAIKPIDEGTNFQGALAFYTHPNSGSAGSPTERMRIDSSGNVGIGTSSPSVPLAVSKNITGIIASFTNQTSADFQISLASGVTLLTPSTGILAFGTSNTERMRIDSSGNLLIGGTVTPTSSAKNLVLYNGTAPTGNATDGVILYAEDVSSSSELKVRDEAGNVTTLSPHNFDLIPEGPSEDMAWSYYSERDGKRINVDMLKAIRLLEQISGEKLVHMV